MSRPTRYSYSMTLRLEPSMDSELENLAFDRHVSKAGFIRRCIRQGIADAYRHGTQDTQNQGAL